MRPVLPFGGTFHYVSDGKSYTAYSRWRSRTGGYALPCRARTSDTLPAQPADCGRRCAAGAPAPEATPYRVAPAPPTRYQRSRPIAGGGALRALPHRRLRLTVSRPHLRHVTSAAGRLREEVRCGRSRTGGYALPCRARTSDTLPAQPADCGRRCAAGAPAPEATPYRVAPAPPTRYQRSRPIAGGGALRALPHRRLRLTVSRPHLRHVTSAAGRLREEVRCGRSRTGGYALPCRARTSDTLPAQPADCGRRCAAGAPAPEATPYRVAPAPPTRYQRSRPIAGGGALRALPHRRLRLTVSRPPLRHVTSAAGRLREEVRCGRSRTGGYALPCRARTA